MDAFKKDVIILLSFTPLLEGDVILLLTLK